VIAALLVGLFGSFVILLFFGLARDTS